jgi:hypothetical protein
MNGKRIKEQFYRADFPLFPFGSFRPVRLLSSEGPRLNVACALPWCVEQAKFPTRHHDRIRPANPGGSSE